MVELLSPAGDYEGFLGALNAGADAVYLGGNSYGARAYAQNFTDDEILRAIDYAHILGKRVFLTVNTLIKESEFDGVIDFIRPFYEAGLDAVIVQDIGLISYIRKCFPLMEVHASTQCFITGEYSAEFFKNLGCKRIVLARELTLPEIREIKDKCDIEVETFIHGSMCYSYSGDCLFSSSLGGRSGNRGRCAGPCRQMYEAHDCKSSNKCEGYILSMKDQCTLNILPKLINSGIDSLKIEGRMKKSEYTSFVTSIYRKYIDKYLNDPQNYKVDLKDIENLKATYLRSDIQEGYYKTRKGKEMISIESPSYNGSDDNLMADIRQKYLISFEKLGINAIFNISQNEEITLTLNHKDAYVSLSGKTASKAINAPIKDDDIKKSLSKLNDTFYKLDEISIYNDNDSFVTIKDINELRRTAISALSDEILKNYRRKGEKTERFSKSYANTDRELYVSVMTKEALKNIIKNSQDDFNIVVLNDICDDESLKLLSGRENIYLELMHVTRSFHMEKLSKILNSFEFAGVVVHNTQSLEYLNKIGYEKKVILGPEIYIFNNESENVLLKSNMKNIVSYELSKNEMKDIESDKQIVPVYTRTPLMVSENCVQRTCFDCKRTGVGSFSYMTDRKNYKFPIYLSCKNCYNIIYNAVCTSLQDYVKEKPLKNKSWLISFTDEDENTIKNVLTFMCKAFKGEDVPSLKGEFTKSYFNKGVE